MTVVTDNHSKRVRFSDGEGLSVDDLNNMQLFQSAQLLENMLMSGLGNYLDNPSSLVSVMDPESGESWNNGTFVSTGEVFAPFPGSGYVKAGGSANQLVCVPGPLLTVIGTLFDGSGESVAPFRLGSTTLTTAVGDATNPRIDLVEVKFEYVDSDPTSRDFEDATTRVLTTSSTNKVRRTKVTIQINQGTPASNPAYPTPSSGFAALAAVYVPANHNAVHSPDNLRDLRFPLGSIRAYDVDARNIFNETGAAWAFSDAGMRLQGPEISAGVGFAYAVCPVASKTSRIVGIGVYGRTGDGAGSNCEIVRVDYQIPSLPAYTTIAQPFTALINNAAAMRQISAVKLMDEIGTQGAYKGTRAVNTRVGTPLWCHGYAAGMAKPQTGAADATTSKVAVKISDEAASTLGYIHFVRFFVAEGL